MITGNPWGLITHSVGLISVLGMFFNCRVALLACSRRGRRSRLTWLMRSTNRLDTTRLSIRTVQHTRSRYTHTPHTLVLIVHSDSSCAVTVCAIFLKYHTSQVSYLSCFIPLGCNTPRARTFGKNHDHGDRRACHTIEDLSYHEGPVTKRTRQSWRRTCHALTSSSYDVLD